MMYNGQVRNDGELYSRKIITPQSPGLVAANQYEKNETPVQPDAPSPQRPTERAIQTSNSICTYQLKPLSFLFHEPYNENRP